MSHFQMVCCVFPITETHYRSLHHKEQIQTVKAEVILFIRLPAVCYIIKPLENPSNTLQQGTY